MSYVVAVILGLSTVALVVVLLRLRKEHRRLIERFAPIVDADAELELVKKQIRDLESQRSGLGDEVKKKRAAWEAEYTRLLQELETVSRRLDAVHDLEEMQSFGLYEPVFDFDTSEAYKQKIKQIRDRQRGLIKNKQAAVCDTQWTVEGSKRKGEAMTSRQLKLMLRAFNGECDTAISKAKFNNVVALQERIRKAFQAINDLGKSNHCSLTDTYLDLKISELQAAYEYADKKQKEKEEQARLRDVMREEEKVRKEVEKAERQAIKEEESFEKALARARAELEQEMQKKGEAKREELRKKVAILEQQLEDAHENRARAIARGRLTRSGHVYIISNIGSFGESVYKIGMTRRLEPLDRVKELGDASVPFRFDVHAMIYSEDAPTLESKLQEYFDDRRVNLVNPRKEFFRVSLDEVENAVTSLHGAVEFVRTAVAEEYRESAAIREERAAKEAAGQRAIQDAAVEQARSRLEELKAGWVAEPVA